MEEEKKAKRAKLATERFAWVWKLSDPHSLPFLKKTVDEKDTDVFAGAIDFGSEKLSAAAKLPHKKAIVRACYHTLSQTVWKLFNDGKRDVAVSGTPGIGKTIFGVLFLIDLVRTIRMSLTMATPLPLGLTEPIVFYEVALTETLFQFTIGADGLQVDVVEDLDVPDNTIAVRDGNCKVANFNCYQFVLTTPKSKTAHEFMKDQPLYCLPHWQTSEMIECWKLIGGPEITENPLCYAEVGKKIWDDVKATYSPDIFTEMMWRRLIKELGHVPRRIFNAVDYLQKRDTQLDKLKQVLSLVLFCF